jgi:hypothetical protein
MGVIYGDIRFRRGLEENLPSLEEGQPGFTKDTKRAFIGSDEGNIELSKKTDVDPFINKVKGLINIAEYDVIGDGINSDQTAIENAVADAYAKGYTLHWGWDAKTYLTTSSILNFHSVKHIGNAIIKRDDALFYINPTGSQVNTLYVRADSDVSFDGLSSLNPVPFQTAIDFLDHYGPVLSGTWKINMGAGTFTKGKFTDGLLSENPIVIDGVDVGGHPNVPTTIISDGIGAIGHGIYACNGTRLQVNNVKAVGYNGNSSSNGLVVQYNSTLVTSNVHTDSCYWGISGTHQARTEVPDGIHENCGYVNGTAKSSGLGAAFRSLMQNNHYIGNQDATNVSMGCIVQNSSRGFFAQEFSTGHVNWITIQDCEDGVRLAVNSRVNGDGILFKRNTRGVNMDGSSHFNQTANTLFATGVDANLTTFVRKSGSQTLGNFHINGYEMSYSLTENIYEMKRVDQTYTATTVQTFHTSVFKAPFWTTVRSALVMGKRIKFKVFGTLTGSTTNKRVLARFSDGTSTQTLLLLFTSSDVGVFTAEGEIYFTTTNTQYLHMQGSRHVGTGVRHASIPATCDTTKDITLDLQCYVDAAGDSITIDLVELSVAG